MLHEFILGIPACQQSLMAVFNVAQQRIVVVVLCSKKSQQWGYNLGFNLGDCGVLFIRTAMIICGSGVLVAALCSQNSEIAKLIVKNASIYSCAARNSLA